MGSVRNATRLWNENLKNSKRKNESQETIKPENPDPLRKGKYSINHENKSK